MTKILIGVGLLLAVFIGGTYAGFIVGVESAAFDREHANEQLQNCQKIGKL